MMSIFCHQNINGIVIFENSFGAPALHILYNYSVINKYSIFKSRVFVAFFQP